MYSGSCLELKAWVGYADNITCIYYEATAEQDHLLTHRALGAQVGVEGGGMFEQQGGPNLAEEVEGCDAGHQVRGAGARTSCYGGRRCRSR